MEEDPLIIQEKKFSSKEFEGFYDWIKGSGPDFKKGSGVLEYLNSVCICNPNYTDKHPNFFDGEVLAHVNYSKNIRQNLNCYVGPFKYREHVKIRWQPKSKEPSLLIKILTERFGLEEIKPSD